MLNNIIKNLESDYSRNTEDSNILHLIKKDLERYTNHTIGLYIMSLKPYFDIIKKSKIKIEKDKQVIISNGKGEIFFQNKEKEVLIEIENDSFVIKNDKGNVILRHYHRVFDENMVNFHIVDFYLSKEKFVLLKNLSSIYNLDFNHKYELLFINRLPEISYFFTGKFDTSIYLNEKNKFYLDDEVFKLLSYIKDKRKEFVKKIKNTTLDF